MSSNRIVVATDPLYAGATAVLSEAGARLVVAPNNAVATVQRLLADADALIVRTKMPDAVLAHAPRLRGIVRHGVGLDFIPMRRAAELGIPVANVPGANSRSVAEYVFAALFELTRKVQSADQLLREEGWPQARALSQHAVELSGKCIGIVGLGNIGREVARIAAHGFGMQVVGNQRRRDTMPDFVRPLDLPELFAVSDVVVLCCPLTEETDRMVGSALIGAMKPTAYLINPARGQLIDEHALIAAVRDGRIAGVALDVFSEQPLVGDHPYRTLRNVLLTPHLASLTIDSMERIGRTSCEEALRMLRGERPLNLANAEVWAAAQRRWAGLGVGG
jgi:D-3-phosphoglycerate dehydrogenase